MSDVDVSAEAVERLARQHDLSRFTMGMRAPEHDMTAATLRALRAALDAAERDARALQVNATSALSLAERMQAERDAALAARDAAQKALRTAAGLANEMSWKPSTRAFADRLVNIIREGFAAPRALQPPASLAAEAPGDAVAQEREACAVIAETMPKPHVESRVSPTGPAWKTPQPDDWPDAIAAAIRARAGA